jgi:hypothetical protein
LIASCLDPTALNTSAGGALYHAGPISSLQLVVIGVRLVARLYEAYTIFILYIKIKISCQYNDIFLTFYKNNFYKYNTLYKFDVGAPIFHTNNFIVEHFVVIKAGNNKENLVTIINGK